MNPREDPLRRLLREDEERRARTPAENGCPEAVTVNGEETCLRGSHAFLENARSQARIGALLKAASPLMLPERRRPDKGDVLIRLTPGELHELRERLDALRSA